ncbi:MAG: hypothetical protein M1365_01715 [Actinobacteria bacterium]|nr:hypothetical protein [Actinomycetota bacterium]
MKNRKKLSSGEILIYEGLINNKEILLVITGIGKKNAKTAAQFIKDNFLNKDSTQNGHNFIEKIIIAGVSGAMHESFSIGDIIICKNIYSLCSDDNKIPFLTNFVISDRLNDFKIIKHDYCTTYYGNLLTVNNIIADKARKEFLDPEFSIDAVDMESYWLLNFLPSDKIPVLCVRSISDNMKYSVSLSYENLINGAFINYPKVIRFVLRNPSEITKLVRNGNNFKKACRSLHNFILSIINMPSS